MSESDAMRLLGIARANGISSIDIMGGEPFMLGWMPRFISSALHSGLSVNVSTNGSLPDALEGLGGLEGMPLQVGISLEGATAATHAELTGSDNFDLAIKSLRTLQALGLSPIAKTVVSRRTVGELEPIARMLAAMGIAKYYLIHMDALEPDDSAYSYPEFVELCERLRSPIEIGKVHASCFDIAGLRCAGGSRKLLIMPDGAAYPCNLLVTVEGFRLGSIFDDPYESIIHNPALEPLKRFTVNHCALTSCLNHGNCTGGCPAHLLARGLSMNAGDPRCTRQEGSVKITP